MNLIKWNPIMPGRTNFGDFFDDFFTKGMADFFNPNFSFRTPSVNIKEDGMQYILEFAVPGLDKDDIKIEMENDHLIVSATREDKLEETEDNYSRREFNYSAFKRSFYLPENIDQNSIEASCKDGILIIQIGKKEEVKAKASHMIEIK